MINSLSDALIVVSEQQRDIERLRKARSREAAPSASHKNTMDAIAALRKSGCYNEHSFEYGWNKAIDAAVQVLQQHQ